MFFSIQQLKEATYPADGLKNPKTFGNPMVLEIFRTKMKTAIYTVYSKKTNGHYWDSVLNKKIMKRHWTPEMKALFETKRKEVTRPPFIFKLTIVGWIFIVVAIGFFGILTYDAIKPPLPAPLEVAAMEKPPIAGDIYFGHYEAFKEKGDRVASYIGFGWFKVVSVDGDTYNLVTGTDMSTTSKPKEQLNSTDFGPDSIATKITEQSGYNINFKAVDGKFEVYFNAKRSGL